MTRTHFLFSLLRLVIIYVLVNVCPLEPFLGSSVYFIYKFRRNKEILVVLLFAITYNLPFFSFGYLDLYFSYYSKLFTLSRFSDALKIHTIFFVILFAFLNREISIPRFIHAKPYLYYLSVSVLLLLILAPVENTLLNSSTYQDIRSSRVIIPIEYGVGFFFFTITYIGKGKYVTNTLAVLFCTKYLLLGMRVAVLEVLLVYILNSDVNKFDRKKLFALGVCTIILMNTFAFVRSGSEKLDWLFVFTDINLSNAGEVLYSSIRILGIDDLGFLSFWDKMVSFFYLLFGFLFPGISVSSLSNLSVYMRDRYLAGGGGLVSVYFYVITGYVGVTLVPILIASLFNKVHLGNNKLLIYVSIVFFMFPRWYSYYPTQLFKFPFYFIIFFLLFQSKKLNEW